MREEKSFRDSLIKSFVATLATFTDDDKNPKDILSAIASWAGKSKDEFVQVLCREIGLAVAAVIKDRLLTDLQNNRIKISIEFEDSKKPSSAKQSAKKKR